MGLFGRGGGDRRGERTLRRGDSGPLPPGVMSWIGVDGHAGSGGGGEGNGDGCLGGGDVGEGLGNLGGGLGRGDGGGSGSFGGDRRSNEDGNGSGGCLLDNGGGRFDGGGYLKQSESSMSARPSLVRQRSREGKHTDSQAGRGEPSQYRCTVLNIKLL